MEKKEKIPDKYKSLFDRKPVLKDVSDVIYRFVKPDGKVVYQNMTTGKRGEKYVDVIRYYQKNICHVCSDLDNEEISGFYPEYVEESDAIVVYTAKMTLTTPAEGQERFWQDFKADFIYLRNGMIYMNDSPSSFRYMYDICEQHIDFGEPRFVASRRATDEYFISPHMTDTCKKLFGAAYEPFTSNNSFSVGNGEENPLLLIHDKCRHRQEKMLIDDAKNIIGDDSNLRDIDVNEILKLFKPKTRETMPHVFTDAIVWNTINYYKKELSVGFLQSAGEGKGVFRIYRARVDVRGMTMDVDADNILYAETDRLYIIDNGVYHVKKFFNEWVAYERFPQEFILLPWKPEDSKGTKLSYLDKYISNMYELAMQHDNEDTRKNGIWDVYLNTETLSKNIMYFADNTNCVDEIFQSPFENIKEFICGRMEEDMFENVMLSLFDEVPEALERKESYMRKLDVPSHMIKTYDKLIGECRNEKGFDPTNNCYMAAGFSFAFMRYCFSTNWDYFRSMNAKQFEELSRMVIEYSAKVKRKIDSYYDISNEAECVQFLVDIYGAKNVKEYLKYVFNYLNFSLLDENGEAPCFNKDHRLEWKNSENSLSAVQYEYQDYLCMSCELLGHEIIHEKPTWKFKTAEEIMTAHDEMQELWERISDEETVKKYEKSFEKQKKKWTGYDYSEKEFSVVLPASPWDIINEGISLHHCVRSYLDNIVSGKTDIVFVRRSSNLEKPFYTLEVKNGRIRQCHGFANCNTSEEKGLDEFLKRFCKEKKVAYANGDKALAAEW